MGQLDAFSGSEPSSGYDGRGLPRRIRPGLAGADRLRTGPVGRGHLYADQVLAPNGGALVDLAGDRGRGAGTGPGPTGDPGARETLEQALVLGEGDEMQHLWPPLAGLAELAWLNGDRKTSPQSSMTSMPARSMPTVEWARGEVGFWMWKAGAIEGHQSRRRAVRAPNARGLGRRSRCLACHGRPTRRRWRWPTATRRRCVPPSNSRPTWSTSPVGLRVRLDLRARGVASIHAVPDLRPRPIHPD